ncbi:GntR family transcriptional regulator [Lutibaculum baratangense]|uniref:Transcriptional regulator, GntR family n=1 Tax=Lutibaculum baratangense AMV1 TaxID=631454 RepID=V4TBI9_9HYPH|nr:GntR family transcriptional regulator [Lutibaculum baratangense]ESR23763.1 Transcriptional regulator, GntR family [Lutibaculum baratangense AMV1]
MLDQTSPFLPGSAPPRPDAKRAYAESRLRDAIIWCELEPGGKVSELQLMQLFSLKRAGVRAALLRLEGEGLVEAVPRHGWRVRPISGAYLGEVVAARRALEAAIPFDRLGEADLLRLEDLAELTTVLAGRREPGSRASHRNCDRELMDVLAGAVGDIRRRWLNEIWDHSERLIRFFEKGGRHGFEPPDRRPLAAACRARDHEAAAAALRGAVDAFEAFVIQALCAQDVEIVPKGTKKPARGPRAETAPRKTGRPAPGAIQQRGMIEWSGKQDS